ncbi:MAG: Osmosensitive channel histidine kinase kdpD [Mycobacterium sp.]|nr:Osmosensitive channel histidine kinase kdpD [Mycobacterium sp.]
MSASRSEDRALIRVYAILRVVVGLAIAIGGLFVHADEADTRLWLIIVAAAWVPVSIVVLIITYRARSRTVLLLGPLADLIMLATAQDLLHQGAGLTVCYPIIAAFAAYTCPGISTWALGGFTLALILLVQSQLPGSERYTAAQFGLFSALVIGVLLIVKRATSRSRGAEERFARAKTRADVVLAAVGTAVVVTDAQSRVLTVNPAADRLLSGAGHLPGQRCREALGLHLGERELDCSTGCQLLGFALGDAEPDQQPTDLSLDGGVLDFEAWRPADDGGRQPLLVSANSVPAAEGPGVEVVHSIRDITRLKQADEAKTLFLATASHELKTPLTVINGYAKTLTTRSLPPEKQRQALAAIRRRGEELARVVDRLLLSSRIEAGRTEVSRDPVDLIPLVYERAAELGEATERTIEVDLPDDLPSVLGDAAAIVTVLDHLLDNAVKYSPGGEPVLVHGTRSQAGPGGQASVVLTITDSGVGMDAATVEHCFDKFWQADASGTRRFGGTGIGLYIVRSLMEAMGGTVSVRSQAGETTFTVSLAIAEPIAAATAGAAAGIVPVPMVANDAPDTLRRRSLLSRRGRNETDSAAPIQK